METSTSNETRQSIPAQLLLQPLVWPGGLGDVAINAHRSAGASSVGPELRCAVGARPRLERLLRRGFVLSLSYPSDEAGLLQGFAKGEGDVPMTSS